MTQIPLSGVPGTIRDFKYGSVSYGPNGPCEVRTHYGGFKPNPWLNDPLPNVVYYVGPNKNQRKQGLAFTHAFYTASDSTTQLVHAFPIEALPADQSGRRWGKSLVAPVTFPGGSFDRGHLIAAQFGGGMERINLVSMPSSVNRRHLVATAIRQGFSTIAQQLARYRNDEHHTNATFTQSGEFATASFRDFETAAIAWIRHLGKTGETASLRVQPTTSQSGTRFVTDIIYVELHVERHAGSIPIIKWKISCEVV